MVICVLERGYDIFWIGPTNLPLGLCSKFPKFTHIFEMPVSTGTMCLCEQNRFLDFVPKRGDL